MTEMIFPAFVSGAVLKFKRAVRTPLDTVGLHPSAARMNNATRKAPNDFMDLTIRQMALQHVSSATERPADVDREA